MATKYETKRYENKMVSMGELKIINIRSHYNLAMS